MRAVRTNPADKSQGPELAGSEAIHLLRDLIHCDFPRARILSFNYNLDWFIDAPIKTIEEVGKTLSEEIQAKRLNGVLFFKISGD